MSCVYVVQFPDRVKVGRAGAVRDRMATHRAGGATRAVAFDVQHNDMIERRSLAVLRRCAEQVGASESFTGVSFIEAESVLVTIARSVTGAWPEQVLAWNGAAA